LEGGNLKRETNKNRRKSLWTDQVNERAGAERKPKKAKKRGSRGDLFI